MKFSWVNELFKRLGALSYFGEERQIEMKGRKQSLRAFPLAQVREFRQVGRPPLVGRRQDLLQLELLKARALEDQRPQLISIIGPAGIGKSRLLEEFLTQFDQDDSVQYATAHCLPYGQSLIYSPLRGMLTELLGGKFDKPTVDRCFCAWRIYARQCIAPAELVLTTLNVEEEESSDRESIFSAWRLLIELFAKPGSMHRYLRRSASG